MCLFSIRSRSEFRLTVRAASPAMRTRSRSRKNATCPGVWPGTAMHVQSGRPGGGPAGSKGRATPGQAPLGDHRADRRSGQDPHQRHDEPPVQRVGVLRPVLTGNERQLAGMHVDRHVPDACQLAGRAAVVGMNVGQQHRGRARPLAEQRLRSRSDQLGAAGPRRVDQRPRAAGPDEVDVRRSDAPAPRRDALGDRAGRPAGTGLSSPDGPSPQPAARTRHHRCPSSVARRPRLARGIGPATARAGRSGCVS